MGKETFISSKSFRERFLSDGLIINGPCQSLTVDMYDRVVCLKSVEWITPAQHWIHRPHSK